MLNLDHNRMQVLVDAVRHMTSLERLSIRSNLLTQLPGSLGQLGQLAELHCEGNRLTVLPPDFRKGRLVSALHASDSEVKMTECPSRPRL